MNLAGKISAAAGVLAESWGGSVRMNDDCVREVLSYLVGYAYVDASASPKMIGDAIRTLQNQAGVVVDGIPGKRTEAATRLPRCGNREAFRFGAAKWARRELTYSATSYVDGITIPEQDAIFAAGCAAWSDVCGIKFRAVDDPGLADLVLSVSAKRFEDFGRRHGVLAWAEMPGSADWENQLRIKFDDAEIWRSGRDKPGTALLNVWTHELGHAIGLDHSNHSGALMAPFYAPDVARPVEPDDKSRAQNLYGNPIGGGRKQDKTYSVIDNRTIRFSSPVFIER